jgi:hypothetical protein
MYSIYKDGNIIKWNLSDVTNAKTSSLIDGSIIQSSIQPAVSVKKKIKFGRKAINQ